MKKIATSCKRDPIISIFEQWYPFVIGVLITGIIFTLDIFPDKIVINNYVLNAIVSLTSILLGFLGVFIALIFSIMNFQVVEIVFKEEHFRIRLRNFFMRACRSGFCLLFSTIMLYFDNSIYKFASIQILNMKITLYSIIKYLWCFLIIYFCLSTYQVISIVIKMAFTEKKKNDKEDAQNDYSELRDKHKL